MLTLHSMQMWDVGFTAKNASLPHAHLLNVVVTESYTCMHFLVNVVFFTIHSTFAHFCLCLKATHV
jgi:hypothetical protein